MAVDWGFASQVGGVGFSIVFVVLVTLAVAIWLVGTVLRKIDAGQEETSDKKKGV
ncbi:OadG family transporter subunit [Chloroflexota bacterium]